MAANAHPYVGRLYAAATHTHVSSRQSDVLRLLLVPPFTLKASSFEHMYPIRKPTLRDGPSW